MTDKTLRDEFALAALPKAMSYTGRATPGTENETAKCAYAIADAMLKTRQKEI